MTKKGWYTGGSTIVGPRGWASFDPAEERRPLAGADQRPPRAGPEPPPVVVRRQPVELQVKANTTYPREVLERRIAEPKTTIQARKVRIQPDEKARAFHLPPPGVQKPKTRKQLRAEQRARETAAAQKPASAVCKPQVVMVKPASVPVTRVAPPAPEPRNTSFDELVHVFGSAVDQGRSEAGAHARWQVSLTVRKNGHGVDEVVAVRVIRMKTSQEH